jgi:hypothetical protein
MIRSKHLFAVLLSVPGLIFPAQVSAVEPETAQQFMARCEKAGELCKLQIWAELRALERSRSTCLPGSVSMEAAAKKIESLLEDVVEEDPDTFRTLPYQPAVRQIAVFLWPCEPIS